MVARINAGYLPRCANNSVVFPLGRACQRLGERGQPVLRVVVHEKAISRDQRQVGGACGSYENLRPKGHPASRWSTVSTL